MWMRSFYGFGPEEDGYAGWTQESGRDHILKTIKDGDLLMIYGAGSKVSANFPAPLVSCDWMRDWVHYGRWWTQWQGLSLRMLGFV